VSYDPEASAEENADEMAAAASAVVAGEVTRAVRDAPSDAGAIHEGDYIGLARDGILSVDETLAGAAISLLNALVADHHEIVTIIEGEGATAAITRRIADWLDQHRPNVAPEIHHGGQPLYPYLFGIE
jgi:dihydroxyacetone kinase-like predicted kinase